jgi:hypothetical protein
MLGFRDLGGDFTSTQRTTPGITCSQSDSILYTGTFKCFFYGLSIRKTLILEC